MIAAIVGPTASGKSALALEVAAALGAEIVSCDSMLVYRGLDVGTAKPSPADRVRIPHHLLDVIDVGDEWSVQQFQAAARAAISDLIARGVPALLVGGSGLYVRAVLDPLEFPPTDPSVRAGLEACEPDELRAELRLVDPPAAIAIEPGNVRRIVRALEVHRITGRPFSSFRGGWDVYAPVPMIGLAPPPKRHKAAIATRARAMLAGGLIEEAGLLDGASRTARAALGYAEALEVRAGSMTVDEAADAIAARTRELARRQRAWFRSDPRVAWFGQPSPAAALRYLEAREAA